MVTRFTVLALSFWLVAGVSFVRAEGEYVLRWTPDPAEPSRVSLEISGVNARSLDQLRQANWTLAHWQRLLPVYAGQGDLVSDVGLPAMTGAYHVTNGVIRFEPRFALEPGVRYSATFYPSRLPGNSSGGGIVASSFQLPARHGAPSTVVKHAYPSTPVLPENLLKFYVHFSAPMSRGHIYDHIHLRDDAGRDIELPFLEIDEELWNPEMTRLTLFIDPGRIKRGVRPLEEVGPALEEGTSYRLVIDAGWKDGSGIPLKETFRKAFQVGPPDREPPDPARWKIKAPAAGTREALTISFPEPMDHALAQRVIRVAASQDKVVSGEATLENDERGWRFVPDHPWSRGPHHLLIHTTIEDLAGKNIGKTFEVDLFDDVQKRLTHSLVRVPFEIP